MKCHAAFWLLLTAMPAEAASAAPAWQVVEAVSFIGHRGGIQQAHFTPAETVLTVGQDDRFIHWDARTGQPLKVLRPWASGLALPEANWKSVGPRGKYVLVSRRIERGGLLTEVVDAVSGRVITSTTQSGGWSSSAVWSQDGEALLFSDWDKFALWKAGDTAFTEGTWADFNSDYGLSLAFSPDHRTLYGLGKELRAYDTSTLQMLWSLLPEDLRGRQGQPLTAWKSDMSSQVLSAAPGGELLLISTSDGLGVLRVRDRQMQAYCSADFEYPYAPEWSSDGQRVTMRVNDFIHVIDPLTGRTLSVIDGDWLLSLAGQETAWTVWNDHLAQFDLHTRLPITTITAAIYRATSVALDQGGQPVRFVLYPRGGEALDWWSTVQISDQTRVPLVEHFSYGLRKYS